MKITVYKDILDKENGSIYIDKYITFFKEHLQNMFKSEDGSLHLEGELACNEFHSKLQNNLLLDCEFKKWMADATLSKLHESIESKGMQLCPLNFFTLCKYILIYIKEQYVVLLKPTIADTIAELKEVKSITFTNGDNSTVTSHNNKAIQIILDNLKENSTTEYEAEKIVRIDKLADKSLIQASFAYNVSLFLKNYFSDFPRRANCCMVSSTEQKLVLYMIHFFGLSPVALTDSRYRQLITYYKSHKSRVSTAYIKNIGYVSMEVLKYKDWKNGLDLDNLELLNVGDTVNFQSDLLLTVFYFETLLNSYTFAPDKNNNGALVLVLQSYRE